jgi:hypothetical protein
MHMAYWRVETVNVLTHPHGTREGVDLAKLFEPLGLPKALADLDLVQLVVRHERGEARDRLPTRAADPEQQHVALRLPDHLRPTGAT